MPPRRADSSGNSSDGGSRISCDPPSRRRHRPGEAQFRPATAARDNGPFARSIFGVTSRPTPQNHDRIERVTMHWRARAADINAQSNLVTESFARLSSRRWDVLGRGEGTSPAMRPRMGDQPGSVDADIDGNLTLMEDEMRIMWKKIDAFKYAIRGFERLRFCRQNSTLFQAAFNELRAGLLERGDAGHLDLGLLA